jgi:hypothetical protein
VQEQKDKRLWVKQVEGYNKEGERSQTREKGKRKRVMESSQMCRGGTRSRRSLRRGRGKVLDEHENSNKENPRNREPGCIYTIEYANSESSSLFFYNPSRETVVYCQSRLRYCYRARVRRSNE